MLSLIHISEALRSKQQLKEKIKQVVEQMNNEKQRINLTDTEAKFIKSNHGIDLNYNCQAAVTEDGIIVSAYTTNSASDRTETIRSVHTAEQNAKEEYQEVIADSGFASYDNYEALAAQDKAIYIPDQQLDTEAQKEQNPYHRNHFTYNPEKNCFICPQNKELTFYANSISKRTKQQSTVYKCHACPCLLYTSRCV